MRIRPNAAIRRLIRDRRGVSAVEFALILPFMMTLFLGSVEVTQAISVKRKVTLTASSVGDLVSRDDVITSGEMTDILEDIANAVMTPFDTTPLEIVITTVLVDDENRPMIECSAARNAVPLEIGQEYDLPFDDTGDPLPEGMQIVIADVTYMHRPMIGYVLTGNDNGFIPLHDTFYLRSRPKDPIRCT